MKGNLRSIKPQDGATGVVCKRKCYDVELVTTRNAQSISLSFRDRNKKDCWMTNTRFNIKGD
jgi:hypothetical protein